MYVEYIFLCYVYRHFLLVLIDALASICIYMAVVIQYFLPFLLIISELCKSHCSDVIRNVIKIFVQLGITNVTYLFLDIIQGVTELSESRVSNSKCFSCFHRMCGYRDTKGQL